MMKHLTPDPSDNKGTLQANMQATMLAVQDANIIIGQYPNGERTIFFGLETLQSIVATKTSETGIVVTIPVDPATDDIEFLCAACETLKGKCDYDGDYEPLTEAQEEVVKKLIEG